GNYFITVTDSRGCSVSDSFTIIQPIQLTIDTVIHTTCSGCDNGIINFTAAPNLVAIQLIPSFGNQVGNSYINLPPASYYICASDSMGCSACDTFTILEDPTFINFLTNEMPFNIYPVPA